MAEARNKYNAPFLQYYNAALQTTSSPTGVDIVLNTDQDSSPRNKFTKLSTTEFRCDFTGEVEVSYKANGYPAANDRAYAIQVVVGGILDTTSQQFGTGKADTNRRASVCCSKIYPVTNGTIIKFQYLSVESDLITFPAGVITGRVQLISEN